MFEGRDVFACNCDRADLPVMCKDVSHECYSDATTEIVRYSNVPYHTLLVPYRHVVQITIKLVTYFLKNTSIYLNKCTV